MKPYNQTQSKREQIRDMFDAIAPSYDMLNHMLSLGVDKYWRRALVREVAKEKPLKVLDMASGTGDMAIMIAKKIEGARVVAADISPQMLALAQDKVRRKALEQRIETVVTEAESMPFGDGEFDSITAAFGVRNFYDIGAGLREIFRVVKCGGTVYILEFQAPQNKIFGAIYRFYFHRVLPRVGGWFSKDRRAYLYLPKSVDEFPATPQFIDMMLECGFREVTATPLTNGIAYIYKGVRGS